MPPLDKQSSLFVRIVIIITILFLNSCNNTAIDRTAKRPVLNPPEEICIGKHIPKSAIRRKYSDVKIYISAHEPNKMLPVYDYSCNNIDYELVTKDDEASAIIFAIYRGKECVTPEGAYVGQKYKDVMKIEGAKYEGGHPFFGYFVKLPSGWLAFFSDEQFKWDGKRNPNAAVTFLSFRKT